jgi:hypothetical protein
MLIRLLPYSLSTCPSNLASITGQSTKLCNFSLVTRRAYLHQILEQGAVVDHCHS